MPEEILAVPLLGHTRGDCGIAVAQGDGWLLDAGDAYFNRNEVATPRGTVPRLLPVLEKNLARDVKAMLANQARLRGLMFGHASEVTAFCSHDPVELAAL